MFDHMLESSHRDDSNKWSNIGFGEETTQVVLSEINFTHFILSSETDPDLVVVRAFRAQLLRLRTFQAATTLIRFRTLDSGTLSPRTLDVAIATLAVAAAIGAGECCAIRVDAAVVLAVFTLGAAAIWSWMLTVHLAHKTMLTCSTQPS